MAIVMRMVYLLLALLAVVALLMLASRLWPASAMQQQARAALEQPLDWPGDNAWALLETLDHDGLDMAQRQALVDGGCVGSPCGSRKTPGCALPGNTGRPVCRRWADR